MKVEQKIFSADGESLHALVFTPEAWGGEPLPMLVFLHGAGERGENIERLYVHGPAKYIRLGAEYPAIVLAPQCPENCFWDSRFPLLKGLIDQTAAEYHADPERISLTGISMGGFGTWGLAIAHPDFFSAIAPCCGGGVSADAPVLRDLPIWACHGDADGVIPVERSLQMIDAIRAAGGAPRLTILHACGHNSWAEFYEETRVLPWLLAQRRGEPAHFA